MAGLMKWLKVVWAFKKTLILILTPLLFVPLAVAYPSKAGRCAYAICVMATYWVTEALPMAVTALLPIVLMPWLGVLGSKEICVNYLKDTNMLFVGGLIVAVAVERWNLHKRIALRVLLIVGSQPKWLMFGFMSSTAFLSMWISNTATTAMMIPIAQAVLIELEDQLLPGGDSSEAPEPEETTHLHSNHHKSTGGGEKHDLEASNDNCTSQGKALPLLAANHCDTQPCEEKRADFEEEDDSPPKRKESNLAKGMCLCVAAAANIGGTGTLTGTGPNLVMKGLLDTLYGPETGINFSSWFIFAFPNMVVCFILAWLWMILRFLGPRELVVWCKQSKNEAAAKVIRREYSKLGPMSFAEKGVLAHFIILAVMWFTREPGFVPGWSYFLSEQGYVTDACVGITVSLSLFMFPSKMPNILCCRPKGSFKRAPVPALLDWSTVQSNLAWGVILVLGGGFALASACKVSGLSTAIAQFFLRFEGFPMWIMVLLLCTITSIFTEVTSNTATATIFLPILAELATSLHVNPLYLIIPVTLSTSFAFMLPVGTPPNAVVFSYGRLKIIDMVESGIVPKIFCLVILLISINTYGYSFFNLGEFPAWAETGLGMNGTAAVAGNVSNIPYVLEATTVGL